MSRTRNERRYLTKKYQEKQTRYYKFYNGPYKDYGRRPEQTLLWKLFGKDQFYNFNGVSDQPSNAQLGRMRNHSFSDCGIPRCPMCGNDRRNKIYNKKDRITIQERKSNESYRQQMQDI